MNKTGRAVFRVGGLKDNAGREEIEHNLIQIDGVRNVQVSVPDQRVNVEFDPGVIREEYLERTLDSLGYSPYVLPNG
ncbi:MAG: heavy-metal-associated domain-containing protein [Peptococcaceae bacterium]|nr:heavy-metal-associated domain-containing protein [Peptococcaceae bacterium]